MRAIFIDCTNLTSVDLSSFDTSNLTNMSETFFGNRKLMRLDLRNFKINSLTDYSQLFSSVSTEIEITTNSTMVEWQNG